MMYAIHLFCDECSQTHSLSIALGLENGPVDRESIGNAYAGKEVPDNLREAIYNNSTYCPNTGKKISQVDTPNFYNWFLVPMKG